MMDRMTSLGTALQLSTLGLMAALAIVFVPLCGVSASCDTTYLQHCVHQLADYERLVLGGAVTYTEYQLDDVCRRFDDIGVCVRRATRSCRTESVKAKQATELTIKQHWAGVESSFTYMCKTVYLRHQKCLSQQPVEISIRKCNRTFHMEKEFAHNHEQLCKLTNQFLVCLHDAVKNVCGAEAAEWEFTLVTKMRQPNMELFYGCTIAGSTIHSNLILTLTSSLLVLLLL